MNKIVRLASHAGTWYEKNKLKLDQELTGYLEKAKQEIPIKEGMQLKALISPHAGYSYSGKVAAWSYKYFDSYHKAGTRVFIIGPSHFQAYNGVSFSSCSELQTPLGNLMVDSEAIATLKTEIKNVVITKRAEEKEHSLELHMPFVRKVFGENCKVIPIMVGTLSPTAAEECSKALLKHFEDQNTVFIISSDFCHWGENYDYKPFLEDLARDPRVKICDKIKQLDGQAMRLIEKNDTASFFTYIEETRNPVCGEQSIRILMNAISQSKGNYATKFVRYDQSNQVIDPEDFSVSYAASITYSVSSV